MSTIAFDTLAYAKRLKSAGFNEQQAEALAEAQAELIDERLATKQDLRELEYRLIIRLGAMLVVAISIVYLGQNPLGTAILFFVPSIPSPSLHSQSVPSADTNQIQSANGASSPARRRTADARQHLQTV